MMSSHALPPAGPTLHSKTMRLTYADCDPSNILYFATWFPWMERVQSEWFHLAGLRQDTLLERHGFATITRATECEYLTPAHLFEEIDIRMSLGAIGRTSVRSESRMTRVGDGALVARGSITLVTIDADGLPTPVPDQLRAALSATTPVTTARQRSDG